MPVSDSLPVTAPDEVRCDIAVVVPAFNEAESAPLAITVTAFADSSRAAGDQLFSVYDRTV